LWGKELGENWEQSAISTQPVERVGDYFLDFEQEKYREASSNEFMRFTRGVWTFAPMNEGRAATIS